MPATTLRFYESEGLITPARRGNGYRDYTDEDLDRVEFIAQAQALDLPLPVVRDLVTAWASEPCQTVRAKYRPTAHRADRGRRDARQGPGVAPFDALDVFEASRPFTGQEGRCDPSCSFLQHAEPEPVFACSLDGTGHGDQVSRWHGLLEHWATLRAPTDSI